ncbi:MAG: helix-turn-helix domain-containing protein [Oligoflexus sp.]
MTQTSLSDYLRNTINDYLKKKSHSLITLSDKSGIHYNTLARILKGRVESPSLETALGILKVCQTGQAAFDALRTFFPDYDVILGMVQTERDVDKDAMVDLSRILSDSIALRILALARSRDGLRLDELRKSCGELGMERLRSLRERDWLLTDGDVVRLNQRKLGMDLKVSHDFLKAFCSMLDQELNQRDHALLWNQVERFNDEGVAALRSAAMDFFHEVESIRNNPRYYGQKPCFVGTVLGSFEFALGEDGALH